MLKGRGLLWRYMGRRVSGLDLPCAASLASSFVCSFGEKLTWPGVQCIWRSMMPRLRALSLCLAIL